MAALGSGTKTGKLIDRIIAKLPKDAEIVKSNIFDVDYFPTYSEQYDLALEWHWTYLPTEDDIIVLLGNYTQLIYKRATDDPGIRTIKAAHPASKRGHEAMDNYVKDVVKKIKSKL